jgi:hypothetical protein
MYWVFHVNGTITFIYNKYSILLYELIIIGCWISIAKHQCMCVRWEKSSQNYFPCRSCGPRSTLWNVVLVRRIRPKTLCFNRAFGWRAQNIASTRHTTSGLFLLRRTRLEWVWLLPNADASTLSISTDATDPSVYESACLCLKTRVMSGAEREFQLSAYTRCSLKESFSFQPWSHRHRKRTLMLRVRGIYFWAAPRPPCSIVLQ